MRRTSGNSTGANTVLMPALVPKTLAVIVCLLVGNYSCAAPMYVGQPVVLAKLRTNWYITKLIVEAVKLRVLAVRSYSSMV